jgi:hypothetical protein
VRRGAALRVMLVAHHGDPVVRVGCRAWEPSGTWAREVGVTTEQHDAVHECMRRERRRNARARESVECWPEVREGPTYGVRMLMKRKQRGWVHGADKLGHKRACARGSQADAAPHGPVQVDHVCKTRESGLTDGARLVVR